jgi:hypothetical protein
MQSTFPHFIQNVIQMLIILTCVNWLKWVHSKRQMQMVTDAFDINNPITKFPKFSPTQVLKIEGFFNFLAN